MSGAGIGTDYGLHDRGSVSGRKRGFFFSPLHPNRLWGPTSLLYNGYRRLFRQSYSGKVVKLRARTSVMELIPTQHFTA